MTRSRLGWLLAALGTEGFRGAQLAWGELSPAQRARYVVLFAAALAVTARWCGFVWPLRPDEAGFLLVAQNWDPQPDSMYGRYWVDRPPLIIALVKAADVIGGPGLLRLVAALGCGALVIAASAAAAAMTRESAAHELGKARPEVVGAWTAVVTAAMVANPLIDPVAAKGEILGVPVLMTSCWLAVRAVQRRSVADAILAGLLATSALGLKQNMIGALVFGAVLLMLAWWRRRLPGGAAVRLGSAALVGAALPIVATAIWAWRSGVHLSAVWYAVYGFRSDAAVVLATHPSAAVRDRALLLVGTFIVSGMALISVWLLARWRFVLARSPVLAPAVAAMLGVDLIGLALGGSFWQAYLFVLIPPLTLGTALVISAGSHPRDTLARHRRRLRAMVTAAVMSTLLAHGLWAATWATGSKEPTAYATGRVIARSANSADTIVVYGGRADLVRASGLASPYPYLWSLPMRTLDADLRRLRSQIAGPRPPTWFVAWVDFDTWDTPGSRRLRRLVHERYRRQFVACNGSEVFVLRSRPRLRFTPTCR